MRIWYPNLLDGYAAISGSSRASTSLSYENVAHDHRARIWRTGTAVATEQVTIDLGSAQSATAAIIFAHTLLNTDSAIQIRKSSDNFVANDVLVATFTWSASAMIVAFGATSERYWRFQFTKAAAGVSRDIGRCFVGNFIDLTGLPDFDGFKVSPIDLSESDRSIGGQVFTAIRPQYREFKLDMTGITQTEMDAVKLLSDTIATHTPFFFAADYGQTDETGEVFYAKFSKIPMRQTQGMGEVSGLAWAAPFEAEEML